MTNAKRSWHFFTSSGNSSGILNWIKTLYGKLHFKLLIWSNPQAEHILVKELAFKQQHVPVLVKMVDEFFERQLNKSTERINELMDEYQRNWRKYVAQTNTMNKEHKLMPEAFIELVKDRDNKLFLNYKNKNPLSIINTE